MNPLDRVKAVLARMGKQLALAILPLAAAAVYAQVSLINVGPYSVCDPTAKAAVAAVGSGIQFTSAAANCSRGTYFSASRTVTGMGAGSTFPVSRDFDASESDAGVGLGTVTLNHIDLDVSVPEGAAPPRIATEDERTLANQGYATLRAVVSAAGIADIPPISRQQTRFTKESS